MSETDKDSELNFKAWWKGLPKVWQIIFWACGLGIVTTVTTALPFVQRIAFYFDDAHPVARLGYLIFLFLCLVLSLWSIWNYNSKHENLKIETRQLRLDLDEAKRAKSTAESRLSQIESTLNKLSESEEPIWTKPFSGDIQFRPRKDRKTVFLSMLNLKGGVGKTTLTANIAACLSLIDVEKRILIVDLDFQGTLSQQCVADEWLDFQWKNGNTSARLLEPKLSMDTIKSLLTPVNQLPNLQIITANEKLEQTDFYAQACFAVNPINDVRFHYLQFHQIPDFYYNYDLVIFDCPPRLTTSSVNAVVCSDYILIPTKLDDNSIEAIPRTLRWMKKRLQISHAELLGIVANETRKWGNNLVKNQQSSYDYLSVLLESQFPGSHVFAATVQYIGDTVRERGQIASLQQNIREKFQPVADELKARLAL